MSFSDLYPPRSRRLKRTHGQMDVGESASTQRASAEVAWDRSLFDLSLYSSTSPSLSRTTTPDLAEGQVRGFTPELLPQNPERRRPSYDYRRPIMDPRTAPSAVIDLTGDSEEATSSENEAPQQGQAVSGQGAQRLPRYTREIIDLSEDTPVGLRNMAPTAASETDSPEVQFVSERRLPNYAEAHFRTPQMPQMPQPPRHLPPLPEPDFDVLIVRENPVRGREQARHIPLDEVLIRQQQMNIRFDNIIRRANHRADLPRLASVMHPNQFGIDMDFETVAFDLGLERDDPVAPMIHPPEPAAKGYTRTPKEDEALVCPNCDDELGVGPTEQKRQIWAIKKCGHVYCGDCTSARSKTQRIRDKSAADLVSSKSQPFAKCVAEAAPAVTCAAPTKAKGSMIQLYL